MSSAYERKHPSPSMSRKMRDLGVENSKTIKNLDKELSRIETERKNKMRELDQATKLFLESKLRTSSYARSRSRECSPLRSNSVSMPAYNLFPTSHGSRPSSRSPSPNPRSPLHDLFPLSLSPSPRMQKIVYRKSLSTEDSPQLHRSTQSPRSTQSSRSTQSPRSPQSPRSISPCSSPEPSLPLLAKRNSDASKLHKSPNVPESSFTHTVVISLPDDGMNNSTNKSTTAEKVTSPKTKSKSSNVGIPTIVVSDTTPKLPEIVPKSSPKKKEAKDSPRKTSPTRTAKESTEGALLVPIRRCRSNSAPNISPPAHHLFALAKKESTFTSTDDQNPPQTPLKFRPRSSSICVPYFAHLKNAPRRESLLRKYMARPKDYHRTSKTIEHLISDLAKGIDHGEFDDFNSRSKPISPEEWEGLKLCRYLRMPGHDEDVKGNTLDVDEIFKSTATPGNRKAKS